MLGASMRMLGACLRKRLGAAMRMLGASMRMLGASMRKRLAASMRMLGASMRKQLGVSRLGVLLRPVAPCGTVSDGSPAPIERIDLGGLQNELIG